MSQCWRYSLYALSTIFTFHAGNVFLLTRTDLGFWLRVHMPDGNAQETQSLYVRQCIIHTFKRVRAVV